MEILDAEGNLVPDAQILLNAHTEGEAVLAGFGSGAFETSENYTAGRFTAWHGRAMAVLRAGWTAGQVRLTVSGEGIREAAVTLPAEA